MGNRKLKWTMEEEVALVAGVEKYGVGKWKSILVDAEFSRVLAKRSNVDLKDKWRNFDTNRGQVCGANDMTPVTPRKGKEAIATSVIMPKTKISSPVFVSKGDSNENTPQCPRDVKNVSRHNAMIFEAISTTENQNGSDFRSILGFIEKKYEVPDGFRRSLSSKLRRLVVKGTLEKVQKRYKIKNAAILSTNTAPPKRKDGRSMPLQNCRLTISAEMLENAAKTAAHKIAEAENKSSVAAEAVKESERVSQMAENADAVVTRLKQILEQCSREPSSWCNYSF